MDDHLRNKRQQPPLQLDSLHITSTYDGVLLTGNDPFGRPGGYPYGIGALLPNAPIPILPENWGPPQAATYEQEVGKQLQSAKDRVA